MTTRVLFDENAGCDHCARAGAYGFDGEKLCLDCYEARGSCCAEFPGNDLTARGDDSDQQPHVCRSIDSQPTSRS